MVQSIESALARRRPGGPPAPSAHGGGSARIPPHDLDAEKSLLGAMLLSRDAIAAAMETCRGDDFYKPAHADVFEAIKALYNTGDPADPVTVADELRRAGLLETVGGVAALVALQADTPATTNAARYARIIEEHALLRKLIAVAGEIAEMGYSLPDDVAAAMDHAESLVFNVAERRVTDSLKPLNELLTASMDRLEKLYERQESITGVPTGYVDLDQQLYGLQPSALVIVGARPAVGKALALDTPIPTPSGWKTMGTLTVGDDVYDDQGQVCQVLYTSPIYREHDCYRIRFDDGSEIVADGGHRWFAYDQPAWKSARERARLLRKGPPANPRLARDQSARWIEPRVVTTGQMLAEGVRAAGDRPNWYLPLAGALEGPEADLPVDPYVLGCWLGDGHTATSQMTIGTQDQHHFVAEFESRGYKLTHRYRLEWATTPVAGQGAWQGYRGPIRVLTRELKAVGLLGGARKHIPAPYLRASAKQRLQLLQGLMDTDGSISAKSGVAELGLANLPLLEQARELVLTLGHKPGPIRCHPIRLADGRTADSWRFTWTPRDPVFLMERKARAQASGVSGREFGKYTRRTVQSIERVPSLPVRCISVSAPSHLFLAGHSMVPTHNTSFALGMAAHAAVEARVPTLVFSLEMGCDEITNRLLVSEARVDAGRMRNGRLTEPDWPKLTNAIARLADAPLFIDDNPNTTVMEIRAKARRLKAQHGLGLIVIDYLQLMSGNSTENRQLEVSSISRGLKILARELEVPVVALSQLSRQLEARQDKRPTLADLRESGSLEQDADVVMFLYRDEIYNPETADRGVAEVIVSKHRNGPTGKISLSFLEQYTRFVNMAKV